MCEAMYMTNIMYMLVMCTGGLRPVFNQKKYMIQPKRKTGL